MPSVRTFYERKDGAFISLEQAAMLSGEEAKRLLTPNALRSLRASLAKLSAAGLVQCIDDRNVSRVPS
jgi:hypothetical protein